MVIAGAGDDCDEDADGDDDGDDDNDDDGDAYDENGERCWRWRRQ